MKTLINKTGITIKELKELVKDLPEKDELGNEFEVWVYNTDHFLTGCSNVAKTICKLNKGDLLISIFED